MALNFNNLEEGQMYRIVYPNNSYPPKVLKFSNYHYVHPFNGEDHMVAIFDDPENNMAVYEFSEGDVEFYTFVPEPDAPVGARRKTRKSKKSKSRKTKSKSIKRKL